MRQQRCFLIAGHTKNICDRRFKDMKRDCRKMDVYSMETLVKLMNKNDKVNDIQVTYKEFSDWGTLFNKKYRHMKAGSIFKCHLFTYGDKLPGTITYQRVHFSEEIKTQILIKGKNKKVIDA